MITTSSDLPVEYYVLIDGQQTGPYLESQLKEEIAARNLSPDVLVWHSGLEDWKPISEVFPQDCVSLNPPASTRRIDRKRFALIASTALVVSVGAVLFISARAAADKREPTAAVSTEQSNSNSSPDDSTQPDTAANVEGPVIKGVYLGMSAANAVEVMAKRGQGKFWIEISEYKRKGRIDYDILFVIPNSGENSKGYKGGGISVDENTKRVTEIALFSAYSDILFNTSDLSASEFAQRFIDSYGIPSLKVVDFHGKPEWRYESPKGWSIAITPDKQVNIWNAGKTTFD